MDNQYFETLKLDFGVEEEKIEGFGAGLPMYLKMLKMFGIYLLVSALIITLGF